MFAPRKNDGNSAATAIVLDGSDDELTQRTQSPPAKKRKIGPFDNDSDSGSDSEVEEIDAVIREKIAALKTEDVPINMDSENQVRFASRSNAPVVFKAISKPEQTCAKPQSDVATFLSTAIPSYLIPASDREALVEVFNVRLDLAQSDCIPLSAVTIGDDCLPTWPLRAWNDPAGIREALEWRVFAQGFGDDQREQIREKMQRRLQQAAEAGMETGDLRMTEDLRLEWQEAEFFDEEVRDVDGQVIRLDGEGDLSIGEDNKGLADSEYFTGGPQSSVPSGILHDDEDLFEDTEMPSAVADGYDADDDSSSVTVQDDEDVHEDIHDTIALRAEAPGSWRDLKPLGYDYSSDSSSSESGDDEDEDESDEDNLHNVFYNAEVVGGGPGLHTMDFEVYLAPNDADLDELPELEVMIDDQDSYAYHHPEAAAGIVNVPLPNGKTMRVTDEHLIHDDPSKETQEVEDTRPNEYLHLPPWAHPDVVLERIKEKHWTMASQKDRERWQKAIDEALAKKAQAGYVEEVEVTDEEAAGCESGVEENDESDVSVEDEEGDEAFKPIKRKADEVVEGEGDLVEKRVATESEDGTHTVVENWLDRRVGTELSSLMEKLSSGPTTEEPRQESKNTLSHMNEAAEKEVTNAPEQDSDESKTVMDVDNEEVGRAKYKAQGQGGYENFLFQNAPNFTTTEDELSSQTKDTLVSDEEAPMAEPQAEQNGNSDDEDLFVDVI